MVDEIKKVLEDIYKDNLKVNRKHVMKVISLTLSTADDYTYLPHNLKVSKQKLTLKFEVADKKGVGMGLILLAFWGLIFSIVGASYAGVYYWSIKDLNKDIDGDGIADINIDIDGDKKADINIDTDKDNKLQYVHQTSWGMSTRIIGAIIMVHGDDSGLVLPPRIAPVQTMIVPIMQKKEGVLDKAEEIRERLASSYKVKVDDSDKSPGWKFSEQEVRGIPTRIEIGPKDIEKNQAVIVRRDTREKIIVSLDEIETKLGEVLEQMQNDMLERAKKHLEEHTVEARNWDEFKAHIEKQDGFVKAMWCGETECEEAIKDETTATTRCMPFEQEHLSDVCVHCGKPAKKMVYFGKAY